MAVSRHFPASSRSRHSRTSGAARKGISPAGAAQGCVEMLLGRRHVARLQRHLTSHPLQVGLQAQRLHDRLVDFPHTLATSLSGSGSHSPFTAGACRNARWPTSSPASARAFGLGRPGALWRTPPGPAARPAAGSTAAFSSGSRPASGRRRRSRRGRRRPGCVAIRRPAAAYRGRCPGRCAAPQLVLVLDKLLADFLRLARLHHQAQLPLCQRSRSGSLPTNLSQSAVRAGRSAVCNPRPISRAVSTFSVMDRLAVLSR